VFERIVVGYDGSERSEDALALARLLSTGEAGSVTAACAYRHEPSVVKSALGGTLECRLVAGSTPRALHAVADEIGADLIVVGSTARGRFGRTFPGTTADRLLHGGPCAVAVAPLGYRERAPDALERVGAAYCEGPEAAAALRLAHSIARASVGRLAVIRAFEGTVNVSERFGELGIGEYVVNAREGAAADLDEAIQGLTDGAIVDAELVDGHPAAVLTARAEDLDLLVMGSRAYGPIDRALLGSVSHAVLLGCPCPVLVVPRSRLDPSR
jgi:nucleotide-binding universal stress UspA family protein